MSVHVSRSRLSDHFVPYYYQIANLLRRKIEEGEILPGAKLPGEFELAESFGVSRVPVRHALSLLVTDGMQTRHRGRGTFVTENPPVQSCSKLFGAIGEFVASGLKGTLKLLGMEHVPAPNSSAEFFGIPAGEKIVRVRRLRTVEDAPFSYVINYLLMSTAQEISIADLKSKTMIFIIEERLGTPLKNIFQTIEARSADSETAGYLGVDVTAPVLYVENFVRDPEGDPVEFSQTFYRGDRFKYAVDLTQNS